MKSFAQPPLSPASPVATDAIHHVALHMLPHLRLDAKFLIAAKETSVSTLQTIQRNISSQLYVQTTANKQNKTARNQRALQMRSTLFNNDTFDGIFLSHLPCFMVRDTPCGAGAAGRCSRMSRLSRGVPARRVIGRPLRSLPGAWNPLS